ncbi:MAG: DegV family protein [Ruminococcaceae bacterium]|nr:DegV family protein [Oscillospiraceae bacterium]
MSSFRIVTDSSCDLSAELATKMNLVVMPLTVAINGYHYRNYPDGRDISTEAFYQILRDKKSSPATSGMNVAEFTQIAQQILSEGEDILYIGLSSQLSGTYPVGVSALRLLQKQYPERKIMTVDSLCVSSGQGLLCQLCYRRQAAGDTLEEVWRFAEGIKTQIVHTFMVDDLRSLRKGGRLYAAREIPGQSLNVKPLLHVDNMGRLVTLGKVRGRKAAIEAIANSVENNILDTSGVVIGHGGCLRDAEHLVSLLADRGIQEARIEEIGPVVGAHSGVGALALFYLGKVR